MTVYLYYEKLRYSLCDFVPKKEILISYRVLGWNERRVSCTSWIGIVLGAVTQGSGIT